jgi:hypothetical protein
MGHRKRKSRTAPSPDDDLAPDLTTRRVAFKVFVHQLEELRRVHQLRRELLGTRFESDTMRTCLGVGMRVVAEEMLKMKVEAERLHHLHRQVNGGD